MESQRKEDYFFLQNFVFPLILNLLIELLWELLKSADISELPFFYNQFYQAQRQLNEDLFFFQRHEDVSVQVYRLRLDF